ncbi:hypothetical protein VPH35_119042 [Triticum aestivum]
MGNILNLVLGMITTLERHVGKRHRQGRIADEAFEPCRVMVLRAISYQAGCKAVHQKRIADGRFELLSILICRAMSLHIRLGSVCDKGMQNDQLRLCCSVLACGVISDYIICHELLNSEKGISSDPFESLPELPLDEAVRTSAVSRKWRFLWTVCPNLSFEGITMCGKNRASGEKLYVQKFIDNVNAVLAQCRGRVVDELAIEFDFDTMLVDHLNNWARFVVSSSQIKFLTFDLAPERFGGLYDRYLFPFQLLDSGSISRLQKIHLSFGYLRPPTGFSGFPNLRKLDLNLVNVGGKDLQDMLSNCSNLEWLSIVRCHLYDELEVNGPLPRLLHLHFSFCEITKIALHAVKLRNFVYKGKPMPCLMHNPCKFSQLRHLKVMLLFENDVDTPHLVSFLTSSPFLETLEMDFIVSPSLYTGHVPMKGLMEGPYKYLKNVCMTAFRGSKGQLEFLLHIVGNAPALGILNIDHSYKQVKRVWKDPAKEAKFVDSAHRTARIYLEGKISPKCSVRLL